ncbi:hypothetical protein BV898_13003 [Hypsibius exemplaris]|uniref:Uncharacterized protein n=1 Tax=Hypsibius exemplaris TaxID=2072580 RepID=A0A1W0WC44_HYPEX|nr:hypothetical protein BV898_13003 [Hypsibius exemplaris]
MSPFPDYNQEGNIGLVKASIYVRVEPDLRATLKFSAPTSKMSAVYPSKKLVLNDVDGSTLRLILDFIASGDITRIDRTMPESSSGWRIKTA